MILTSRRMLRRSAATIIAAASVALGGLLAAPQAANAANPANLTGVRTGILAEHNQVRSQNGLGSLAQDSTLSRYAQNWSATMAASGSMYHSQLSNVRALDPARFSGVIAENIAMGQSPADVTEAWRDSPGHFANMTNAKVNAVGFGYALDANGTPYYTAVFAFAGGTTNQVSAEGDAATQTETAAVSESQPAADDAGTGTEQAAAGEEAAAEESAETTEAAAAPSEGDAAAQGSQGGNEATAPEAQAPAAQPQTAAASEEQKLTTPSRVSDLRTRQVNTAAPESLATTGAAPGAIAVGAAGLLAALAGAAFLMHRRKQRSN